MSMAVDTRSDMTLGTLLGEAVPAAHRDLVITGITTDSRRVAPGDLFLALAGSSGHGLHHVSEALARGAAAVAWEPADALTDPEPPAGAVAVAVPRLRAGLGALASRFFGEPSRHLGVVGVTGTNGKTTVTWLVTRALEELGRASALIGTLGAGHPGHLTSTGLTTPDAADVQRLLARFVADSTAWVGMEVSSHALEQRRVDGVSFRIAAFTNLSREHLDYHGTLEAYGAAKARLFRMPGLRAAVINTGDAFGRQLVASLGKGVDLISVGHAGTPALTRGRRLHLKAVEAGPDGLALDVSGSWGRFELRSPLFGRFNAENLLVALGCLLAAGVDLDEAVTGLSGVTAPPGRMEPVTASSRPLVIVDYAHTPDALEKALEAARVHCKGRLWIVFGCGGERDPGKRPEMARVAERLADRVVVTDDNPRNEDPAAIVADIRAGLRDPGAVPVEHDRAAAIALAIRRAARADVVLIAGKGHEDYQIRGGQARPFSDTGEAARALEVRS